MELDLLKTLTFDLMFDHPWSYAIEYSKTLKLNEAIVQKAVYLINDSFGTKLPLIYPPEKIAAALLIFSGKILNLDVSTWYEALNIDKLECSIIQFIAMKNYNKTTLEIYRFYPEIVSILKSENIKLPFADPPVELPKVDIPVITNDVPLPSLATLPMTQNPFQQHINPNINNCIDLFVYI